jgi:hypothetical protein
LSRPRELIIEVGGPCFNDKRKSISVKEHVIPQKECRRTRDPSGHGFIGVALELVLDILLTG